MKTYVINLKSASDRKNYITSILNKYPYLDIEFIEAVDGRKLTSDQQVELFNIIKFENDTLKQVLPGEIGCTLSHQKCYNKFLNTDEKYALILEDDIIINYDINSLINELRNILNTEKPIVILLSGWFWYGRHSFLFEDIKIAKIEDGYLTHAYLLNRSAAHIMIDDRPWYVADRWDLFRKRGITIYGILPHPIDQDWGTNGFSSDIVNKRIKSNKVNVLSFVKLKIRMLKQRIYSVFGHFEKPNHLNIRLENN